VPVTEKYYKLTPKKRHDLYVKCLMDGVFVTGGEKLQQLFKEPQWKTLAQVLSPFFSHLYELRTREICACRECCMVPIQVGDTRSIVKRKDVSIVLSTVFVTSLTCFNVLLSAIWHDIVLLQHVDMTSPVHIMMSFDSRSVPHAVRYPCFVKYKSSIDNWPHLGYLFLIFRCINKTKDNDFCLNQEVIPRHPHHEVHDPCTAVKPSRLVLISVRSLLCMSHVMRANLNPPYTYTYNRHGDYWCMLPSHHPDDIRCSWERTVREDACL